MSRGFAVQGVYLAVAVGISAGAARLPAADKTRVPSQLSSQSMAAGTDAQALGTAEHPAAVADAALFAAIDGVRVAEQALVDALREAGPALGLSDWPRRERSLVAADTDLRAMAGAISVQSDVLPPGDAQAMAAVTGRGERERERDAQDSIRELGRILTQVEQACDGPADAPAARVGTTADDLRDRAEAVRRATLTLVTTVEDHARGSTDAGHAAIGRRLGDQAASLAAVGESRNRDRDAATRVHVVAGRTSAVLADLAASFDDRGVLAH
jgi:hypothetical protein